MNKTTIVNKTIIMNKKGNFVENDTVFNIVNKFINYSQSFIIESTSYNYLDHLANQITTDEISYDTELTNLTVIYDARYNLMTFFRKIDKPGMEYFAFQLDLNRFKFTQIFDDSVSKRISSLKSIDYTTIISSQNFHNLVDYYQHVAHEPRNYDGGHLHKTLEKIKKKKLEMQLRVL